MLRTAYPRGVWGVGKGIELWVSWFTVNISICSIINDLAIIEVGVSEGYVMITLDYKGGTMENLDFIPCDLHPDEVSVGMVITSNGRPLFQCARCQDMDDWARWKSANQMDQNRDLLGKPD